jgi:glycosyltransferase involved in cell wall biosynthesis
VIPSRDRPTELRETLRRLRADPSAVGMSVVVCDNGASETDTQDVADAHGATYVRERLPGLSRARNTAIDATDAEVLVFLDDDISVPAGWAGALTAPVTSGWADASVCQIGLGTDYDVSGIPLDSLRMLMVDSIDPDAPFLAGSFAVARAALDSAGRFNVRLGVGSGDVGGGEDLFLTLKLRRAGYRIAFVPETHVKHRIHPDKLTAQALLRRREAGADTDAWLAYHYFGRNASLAGPKWRVARLGTKLAARFERTRGYAGFEGRLAASAAWHRRMAIESGSPRVCKPDAATCETG